MLFLMKKDRLFVRGDEIKTHTVKMYVLFNNVYLQ